MLKFALTLNAPVAIRYPKGEAYDGLEERRAPLQLGKSEPLYEEEDIALLPIGSMVKTAVEVRQIIKDTGYSCSLINARFAKPIDEEQIRGLAAEHKLLVTMEENVDKGGFGDSVRAYVDSLDCGMKVLQIAIPDVYVEHGSVNVLKEMLGIDAASVAKRVIMAYLDENAEEAKNMVK